MNEVIAANHLESQLNGEEYVNLCSYLRLRYETAMVHATNMTIRIKDVEIGEMVMTIERYIRQCDAQKKTKRRK